MALRFRKSIGFGFGRVNLSKSGASLSFGGRGNTINIGRRGVRHTVGIPGTGLSYSRKIGGSYAAPSPHEARALFERADAAIATGEAQLRTFELSVAEAEKFEPHMSETEKAELEIYRAKLNEQRVELRQAKQSRRRAQIAWTFLCLKKMAFWGFMLWLVWLFFFKTPANAQDFDLFTWRCGNTTLEYADEEKPENGGGAGLDTELTVRVTNPPPGKFTVQIRTTQHAISTWGAKLNGKPCVRKPYGSLERPR
jgi:hypothetical protein